jgi:membrane protease YdiL (CAAX protease family)
MKPLLKKNKIFFFILISVFLAFLGEEFIPENPFLGEKNIRLIIENTYIYGFIYLPIPIIFLTKIRKNLIFKILFLPSGIFFISYLYRTEKASGYIGFLYLFTYLVINNLKKDYKEELNSLGLDLKNFKKNLVFGIIASLLLSGHLIFTVNLTSYSYFKMLPLDKFFYWVFFEIGMDALGEEMFYRRFVFGELYKHYFNFWGASFISTIFYILVYLAKPYAFSDAVLLICIIFYHLLQGVLSCYIYSKTKNLTGCIVLNVIFSMVANSLVLS